MIPCISTLSVHESPFGRIVEWMKSVRFNAWEVIDEKPNELDVEKIQGYRRAAPSSLAINVHGPYNPLTFGHFWFKRMEITISMAGLLRSTYVVVHAPRYENLDSTVESLEKLSHMASRFGINLLVENCMSRESAYLSGIEDFVMLFDTASSKNLGLCLDVGHAYVDGSIDGFLRRFYEKIMNVHLHDNDGLHDLHLPLDAGKVPWRRVLDVLCKRGYEGFVTLECKSKIEESLNKINEALLGRLW